MEPVDEVRGKQIDVGVLGRQHDRYATLVVEHPCRQARQPRRPVFILLRGCSRDNRVFSHHYLKALDELHYLSGNQEPLAIFGNVSWEFVGQQNFPRNSSP